MHTAVSKKVVGKSTRNNSQRYCWWFWVYCFSNKNNNIGTKAHERMLASAKLKESNKGGFDTAVPGTLYWSYPVLPFGIVACKLFRQPLSKQLYLHVFLLKSISDFIPNSHLLHHHHCLHLEKKVLLLKAILNVDVNLVLQNRVSWEGTFYRKQNLRLTCVTFLASSYIL